MRLRTLALTFLLCTLAAVIVSLFWYNEWRYSLPTPVPATYQPVAAGTPIALPASIAAHPHKPVFLHFFNPDCPCSRFNMPHVKSLIKQYGDSVDFAIVLMTSKPYTAKQIEDKYGVQVPVFRDSALAEACGVYSTPQAVLMDGNHKLFYRGNYNRTRYCTDSKTNYAQIALEGLLHQGTSLRIDSAAFISYGCVLPSCTQ